MTREAGQVPTAPVRVRSVSPPVLLAVAVGFGVAVAGPWRPGLVVAGVALLVGAGLRTVLPAVRLGMLVVRSRPVDIAVMVVAGGLLVGVALTFPTG